MPDSRSKLGNARMKLVIGAVLGLSLVLVACGKQQPPGQGKGRVSGTVVVGAADASDATPLGRTAEESRDETGPSSVAAANFGTRSDSQAPSLGESTVDFVPGELIVRYDAGGLDAAALPALEVAGETFMLERTLAAADLRLYVAPGLDRAATLAAAEALNERPDVLYAQPNYLLQPALAPNDPFYDRQWHYDALNMEAAWDVSIGDRNVVVAVLDSGIIADHPDFAGRLLPGYDFISTANNANDGDGRDPDPYDDVDTGDGYHGTHVAGTIGAATNNGTGVAGVDWNAKILPVRVLGTGGGAQFDILEALIWAVGGSVTGVPTNTNPADVINLSLGGELACSQSWQDVFDTVSQFAVVVAAAGNLGKNAADFVPANCQGLITVGATDFANERSYYSNYGSAVDIMAPGGDMTHGLFDPGRPDGVLSLGYNGSPQYVYMQGTSMAAPHVSGIVALMKAIDPSVDFVRALEALRASATPLTDSACDGPGADERELFSEDCGAGLIDAGLALEYIESGELPPPDGALAFAPTTLNLGQSAEQATYTITNVTDQTIDWVMDTYIDAVDNPDPVVEDSVLTSATSGQLAPGESQQLTVFLEREMLTADGFYRIWLVFEVPGEPNQLYQVRFLRNDATVPSLQGPMVVAAFKEDETGALVTSGEQQSSGVITSFDFEVDAGLNLLGAWSDEDANGVVNAGDFVGFGNDFVNVPAGGRISGLSLRVDPVIPDSSGAEAERYRLFESLRPAP